MVSNFKQADALLDGPLGKALIAKLPEKGLVALGFWDLGFRNVTNSKRPITKGEDLEGLKLRVIPNPVFLETFKTFKANPVPMPFAELYNALESKAVDGQENPFAVILSNKFYEVQKYLSATNHVYAANIMLISKRFWDRLSPAEQKMLQDAANEARDYQRQVSRDAAPRRWASSRPRACRSTSWRRPSWPACAPTVKPVDDKFVGDVRPGHREDCSAASSSASRSRLTRVGADRSRVRPRAGRAVRRPTPARKRRGLDVERIADLYCKVLEASSPSAW